MQTPCPSEFPKLRKREILLDGLVLFVKNSSFHIIVPVSLHAPDCLHHRLSLTVVTHLQVTTIFSSIHPSIQASSSQEQKTRRKHQSIILRQEHTIMQQPSKRTLGRASVLRILSTIVLVLVATTNCCCCCSAWIVPDPIIHFGIGAVAGGVGAFVAFPFDYIKVQLQTEQGKEKWAGNGIQAFRDTLATDGPLQFYKGAGVQLIGVAPEKAIKLGVNDVLASMFIANYGVFPLWGQILSGSVAGACQVVASSPLEVLKTGLQTSDKSLPEVWKDCGGVRGLFRGSVACMGRDIVFTAICFPLYKYCVEEISMPTFFAGALSGSISSFSATPPDVVKTRILSQPRLSPNNRAAPDDDSISSILVDGSATVPVALGSVKSSRDTGVTSSTALFAMLSNSTSYAMDATDATLDVTNNNNNNNNSNNNKPSTLEEFNYATTQQQQQQLHPEASDDAWVVFKSILKNEGVGALFSGGRERGIGAIPRFGTTLAMHDFLEHAAYHAGWLSHATH